MKQQAYVLLVNVESIMKNQFKYRSLWWLSQEVIFSSDIENIKFLILTITLNVCRYFCWLFWWFVGKENLDNIIHETKVLAEISYKKYNEWIKIKKFLINNEKILKYNILIISNNNATIELIYCQLIIL